MQRPNELVQIFLLLKELKNPALNYIKLSTTQSSTESYLNI